MTLTELKTQIENANNVGRTNLNAKGVTTDGTETTYQIMSKIASISGEGGSCNVDHVALRQEGYDEGFADGQASVPSGKRTKTGEFSFEGANTGTPTITHNCGFVPTVFIVYPIDECPTELTTENQMILGCVVTNTDYFSSISATNTSNTILELKTNGITWNLSSTKDATLTETTATLGYATSARLWRANFQYGWIAIE